MERYMDNDKQIAQNGLLPIQSTAGAARSGRSVSSEVQMFLHDELLPLKEQNVRNVYDLEGEYAKTKKNNSPFIAVVLLVCFLVVGAGALLAVMQIRSRDSRIAVSLDVFDDVNLKNLIDTVSRTQEMYEQAVKNLSSLQGDLDTRINEAALKRSSDEAIIDSMRLSKKETASRKKGVADIYNKSISDIHAEYDGQITSAANEIEEYKARLAEYDNAKVKSAQERDRAVDSERRLQNLERQKLIDKYEARIQKLEDALNEATKRGTKEKTDTAVSMAKKYTAEIDGLNAVIAARDKTIAEQIAVIAERDATIAKQDATIAEQKAAIAARDKTIAWQKSVIAERDETIVAKNQVIAAREKTIAEREDAIAGLKKSVASLNKELSEREGYTEQVFDILDTVLKTRNIAAISLKEKGGKLYLHVRRELTPLVTDGTEASVSFMAAGAKRSTATAGVITHLGKDIVFTPLPDKNGNIADISAVSAGSTVTLKLQ